MRHAVHLGRHRHRTIHLSLDDDTHESARIAFGAGLLRAPERAPGLPAARPEWNPIGNTCMRAQIFQVDAFTTRLFTGNPAAVMLLDQFEPDAVLQAIAAENN